MSGSTATQELRNTLTKEVREVDSQQQWEPELVMKLVLTEGDIEVAASE